MPTPIPEVVRTRQDDVRVPNMPQYSKPQDARTTALTPPPEASGSWIKPTVYAGREYVAGRPDPRIARYIEALPQYIDDVTRDFGSDVYERMMYDAQVFSCVEILKLTVMSTEYNLSPAVDEKNLPDGSDNPEYKVAEEICQFCDRVLKNLPRPFEQFVYEMLDAMPLGHKVAEKTWAVERCGQDKGAMVLASLKVKPQKCYTFVVDSFLNVVGLVAIIPGRSYILYQGSTLFDPDKLPNILPREKFCVLTYNPRDNDPRGRSVLRPAYDPWWCKLQVKTEYLKFLSRFASPSVWGTTPPGATAALTADASGNVVNPMPGTAIGPNNPPTLGGNQTSTIGASGPFPSYTASRQAALTTPEQAMAAELVNFQNGSVFVGPAESHVEVIQPGNGGNFIEAFNFYDKQVAKAILGQTLATEEGEHQARAAADVHADILDLPMRNARRTIETMVKNDILYYIVKYNYGDEAAKKYTPHIAFGEGDEGDWHRDVEAIMSMVQAQFLAPSQYTWADEKLKLPARTDKSPSQQPPESGAEPGKPHPAPGAGSGTEGSNGASSQPAPDQPPAPGDAKPIGGLPSHPPGGPEKVDSFFKQVGFSRLASLSLEDIRNARLKLRAGRKRRVRHRVARRR